MYKKYLHILFIVSLTALVIASCNSYDKLLKSTDNEKKYNAAMKYYEDKNYDRAQQLFDVILPIYRGSARAEKIYYCYAYSYYYMKDYMMAAYNFKNFYATFPKSDWAEECLYMSAYCQYLDSPVYSLDQEITKNAIQDVQLFINKFPNSSRIAECNKLIDELRFKLETKAFEIARLYYNIEDYKAAVTAFANLSKDFPDTKYREESMVYITKAYYYYARRSIDEKKLERYQAAAKAYENLLKFYPESNYLKELSSIYKETNQEIKLLSN